MKTELEGRTRDFGVRIVKLIRTFPKTVDGFEVGRQLLRSGTSVGANYREANRAESKNDFVHKVGIAEKEAAETMYWLETCAGAMLGSPSEVLALSKEATELLAILTTIGRKAKGKPSRLVAATILVSACLAAAIFSLSAFPLSAFHLHL
jgi:four helix bundle protein